MDATALINEMIDLRSFSNLWFWIALAGIWFSASHWVMGIPYDLALRGRAAGTEDEADFRDSVRVSVNRMTRGTEAGRVWTVAVSSFVLTVLVLLGFLYRIEFAQALFLLGFPLSLVWVASVRLALGLRDRGLETLGTDEIFNRIRTLRVIIQGISVLAIVVTSFWGMYVNATIGVLGR